MAAEVGDDALTALVRCAADGCWWADVFSLSPPSAVARQSMIAQIDNLLVGTKQ
jgi:Tetracyclin repressor-like, C-terminal domain